MKGLQSSLQRSEGIPYVKVQQSAIWGNSSRRFSSMLALRPGQPQEGEGTKPQPNPQGMTVL